jgi:Flp pilus assembly protein TadD
VTGPDAGVFEKYRNALRRGHVAALRGRSAEAIAAYHEAAALVPDRAAPHVGRGRVELDAGDQDAAREAFEAALSRDPEEVVALDGLALALMGLDRPVDAAGTLDRLAAVTLAAGDADGAVSILERAVALADSRQRRREIARLRPAIEAPVDDADWLRELPPEAPGETDDAEVASAPPASVVDAGADRIRALAERVEAHGEARDVPGLMSAARALARHGRLSAALDACFEALTIAPTDPEVHGVLATLYDRRGWDELARHKADLLSRYLAILDDPGDLDATAEAAEASGDAKGLISVAARHLRQARPHAALEACYVAVAIAPGDPAVHLALAQVRLALGWRRRAVAGLTLLARLVELTDDTTGRELLADFVRNELSGDEHAGRRIA